MHVKKASSLCPKYDDFVSWGVFGTALMLVKASVMPIYI